MNQKTTDLRMKLEAMIVKTIRDKLVAKDITVTRAREISRTVLNSIPTNITHEQLMQVLPKLKEQITELSNVVYEILKETDQKLKEEILARIRATIDTT